MPQKKESNLRMRNVVMLISLLLLAFLIYFQPSTTLAENIVDEEVAGENVEEDLLDGVSLSGIEQYWDKISSEYRGFVPELEKTTVIQFLKDKESFSIKNILKGLLQFLFHELILNGKLLGTLIILTLFSAMLQTIHTAFEKNAVSKIAYFVVYMVLIFIMLNSFYTVFQYTKDAIDMMSGFMMALLPLLLGLMASFGSLIAVSFFQPVIIFLIYMSTNIIAKFSLPLLFLSALLVIVSNINPAFKVTHLSNLLKSVALGTLGVLMTIFISVISIQGTATAVQDGVAMKATKFVTGNFIPVVGRTFTDATDTIFTASLLLKNAVGIVGLMIIAFITLFPILKIFAIALIYKVAAAILQPIGDGPMIDTLQTMSKYILYVLACLIVVSFMFFLTIVIIVVASNVTILLR